MINCDHCGKVFRYNCHLLRHLSSKTPCYSKSPPEFVDINIKEDVMEKRECYEVNDMKKDDVVSDNDSKKKHQCSVCQKRFFNKKDCESHESKCTGLHKLQCPTCLKFFANRCSKSQHISRGTCKPAVKPPENKEQFCQPVNGGTVNITNNIDNSTNNTLNDNRTLNNVFLVNFSDTDYSHISVEQIVRMVSKCDASPSRFFNMMITEAHKNEYANVGLSNIKGNYATIYDEQQFLKVSAEEIAEEIGIKIAHRMDDCVSDSQNKEILKQGNIYRRVKSYSWIEDVVRGVPAI